MSPALRRALYAGVIFWSALLLLLVQPVLTRAILPWFGGSAGVWTTSMLFYQTVLLLGYLYAHLVTRRLPARAQVALHASLLIAACLLLPLRPSPAWKPTDGSEPVSRILLLLFTSAGLPYFLLSTTSPLLQAWYARSFRTHLPWRLFAVSNAGSLAALLAYPVLIEPAFTVQAQLGWWSAGFIVFAILCVAAALLSGREAEIPVEPEILPPTSNVLVWLALAAVPSVLWLAVAGQLSQDVAPIPFLWILPLALYLLSFVLTFDSDRWYRPRVYRWLLPLAWISILMVVAQQGFVSIVHTILLYAGALFLCCMFCHGELARLRPDSRALTSFYLTIAAGGAMGGLFVGIVAPRIFNEYLELPIGMLGCVVLALWLLYRMPSKRVLRIAAVALLGTVAALVTRSEGPSQRINLRNFYGTLQVSDGGEMDNRFRALYNGTIQHGVEFLGAGRRRIPTTYYGPASGAALALSVLEKRGPVRVGVIGLGAGTMAAYARPGDFYRFYEINPAVIDIARTQFRYLAESPAPVDIVAGDGRLSLEREAPQNFDLLVVDAFSGDSIPIHLLTREAFAEFFRHIAPGGAVAVHVTNKHLDLAPVVKLIAGERRAHALLIHNSKEDARKIYNASWVIVTPDDDLDKKLGWLSSPIRGRQHLRLWTDDYSNLFSILR
jgi:hypothetical protein